jgi:PIN domain nuclease of toxin-antitoxin system
MRALLDTHAFLWWITDDPRLSRKARQFIATGTNTLFFSAASGWEIAIKAGLGRLTLDTKRIDSFVTDQMTLNAISSLPVQMNHALHVHSLASHHRDPFDRLLVAQAQLEDLPIITSDAVFSRYPVTILW